MKKAIFNLRNLLFMLALGGLVACEGPEGPEGPAGQKGDQGVAGPEGPAGEDGNANVTIINLLSENITWEEGDYLGRVANTFTLTSDAVNEDIIDHGVVLGYFNLFDTWYQLPFTWEKGDGSSRQYILHTCALNTITLYAYETTGALDVSIIPEYKFLLVTDNTVSKGASSEYSILSKLNDAGVDVNNYYDVLKYYGVKY